MIVDNGYPDPRVQRQALALVARGHHVDVICAQTLQEPRTAVIDGVNVYRMPVFRQRGAGLVSQLIEYAAFVMWAAAQLLRLQRHGRYDVVQVHNVPDFLVLAALPAKVIGTPILLDLHDLMPEFFASRFGGRMNSLPVTLVRWQERASRSLADHVITVTELWRQTLISRGASPDRVDVVMNTPDERLYPRRAERPDAPGPVKLIYHGTVTYRYGLDLLLRAVALASERVPLRLTLHGRGEMADDVSRLVDELGLRDVVTLSREKLAVEDLAALIAQADIGVVPNRNDVFTDGILPTKLMEYAAIGVPAIVARSSATTTYFGDDMVRYVDPEDVAAMADAIVELAERPDLRRELAARARAFQDAHPWSAEANRYLTLVEALAERRRPRAPLS
jgi:glycosyltransferase involved in cell wall biosynthesis